MNPADEFAHGVFVGVISTLAATAAASLFFLWWCVRCLKSDERKADAIERAKR